MSASSLYQAALAHMMNSATPPKPMSLRASASIVLWRTGVDGRTEVFWVRRNPALGVLGGWRAFPGGGVSKNDVDLPLVGQPAVSQEANFPRYDIQNVDPDLSHAIIAAGLRELWEETGILLTQPPVDPPSSSLNGLQQNRSNPKSTAVNSVKEIGLLPRTPSTIGGLDKPSLLHQPSTCLKSSPTTAQSKA